MEARLELVTFLAMAFTTASVATRIIVFRSQRGSADSETLRWSNRSFVPSLLNDIWPTLETRKVGIRGHRGESSNDAGSPRSRFGSVCRATI